MGNIPRRKTHMSLQISSLTPCTNLSIVVKIHKVLLPRGLLQFIAWLKGYWKIITGLVIL